MTRLDAEILWRKCRGDVALYLRCHPDFRFKWSALAARYGVSANCLALAVLQGFLDQHPKNGDLADDPQMDRNHQCA